MGRISTAQAAELVGVHRDTLLRWLREGRVPEPSRDAHGWRVFDPADIERLKDYAGAPQDASSGTADNQLSALRGLDWDFADARTVYLTHGIHPYPAKFIPQIPNALIQELSSVGDTVADIFCGSGTTLVEALLLKRHAIGIDANPIAALISTAKTTRIERADETALSDLASAVGSLADRIAPLDQGGLGLDAMYQTTAPRPADDAIGFWFEPFVVEELAQSMQWARELPSEASRTVALAAFSAIVVAVSRQDSDTRYVRREKSLKPGDALRRYARQIEDVTRSAARFTDATEPRFNARVLEADLLTAPDMGPVDLVVCSPPYPNAYSYHLYHMTRMLWLGFDAKRFKAEEIGSHRKYSQKGPRAATAETFRREMDVIFGWLRRQLKIGGFACFVVGQSLLNGELVDNAQILADAAGGHGFVEAERIERRLRDSRKAFNPAIGRVKTEEILVLRLHE